MNKKEYSKPVAEFIQFDNEDIITASGNYGCDWGITNCSNMPSQDAEGFCKGPNNQPKWDENPKPTPTPTTPRPCYWGGSSSFSDIEGWNLDDEDFQ